MEAENVTITDVKDALERIKSTIKKTPVFEDDDFNEQYGCNFYFKAENMQRTGAFKIRGVSNAVSTELLCSILSLTLLYRTVHCDIVLYSTVPCRTVLYSFVWYQTLHHTVTVTLTTLSHDVSCCPHFN